MLKKIIVNIIIITLVFAFLPKKCNADVGAKVTVKIESFNKTILNKEIIGGKFKQVLDMAAKESEIEIIYSHAGLKSSVYSVDGLKNNSYMDEDQWLGFVKRGDIIINKEDDFLDVDLKNGDVVTLFYGKKDFTKIISKVEIYENKNLVNFDVTTKYLKDNKTVIEKVPNVKINIINTDQSKKFLITDSNGKAYTKFDKIGIYEYFFADDSDYKYLSVVNYGPFYYLYGLKDNKAATRGEIISFFVNQFGMKKKTKELKFSDLDTNHPFYDDIMIAVSNNFISGYDDGTLRPDQKISLFELVLMLSNFYNFTENSPIVEETNFLPNWAKQTVSNLINANVLKGLSLEWNRNITNYDIEMIYENFKNQDKKG